MTSPVKFHTAPQRCKIVPAPFLFVGAKLQNCFATPPPTGTCTVFAARRSRRRRGCAAVASSSRPRDSLRFSFKLIRKFHKSTAIDWTTQCGRESRVTHPEPAVADRRQLSVQLPPRNIYIDSLKIEKVSLCVEFNYFPVQDSLSNWRVCTHTLSYSSLVAFQSISTR